MYQKLSVFDLKTHNVSVLNFAVLNSGNVKGVGCLSVACLLSCHCQVFLVSGIYLLHHCEVSKVQQCSRLRYLGCLAHCRWWSCFVKVVLKQMYWIGVLPCRHCSLQWSSSVILCVILVCLYSWVAPSRCGSWPFMCWCAAVFVGVGCTVKLGQLTATPHTDLGWQSLGLGVGIS